MDPGSGALRMNRLSSARNFAGLRVHAHDLAFFDEKRYAHRETSFQRRLFARAARGGVTAQAEFR